MSKAKIIGWARPSAPGLLLALLLWPGSPASADRGSAEQGSGPSPVPLEVSSQTARIHIYGQHCLRVAAVGVRTRNSGTPTTGGVITLPPVVTAGSAVWAGLYWEILADAPTPNAVTLNGAAVVPVLLPVTASPCWPQLYAFPYFADVTALVIPGANAVAGLDDSGVPPVSPNSEGASLVVIYKSTNSSACEIIVTDGNDLTAGFGQQYDNPLPVSCGTDQPATLYFIGGDGQSTADDQRWNLAALGDGSDFDASDPATPGALADVGWDTDGWNVVTSPPNVASLSTPSPPVDAVDCINWIATVLEVGVTRDESCAPVPTDKSTWGRMKERYR